jgi:hypothetical protein
MAKVNERNRRANLEATRKAEQMEAERRKRERKLAAAARASNSPAPSALAALKIGVSRYVMVAALPETTHLTHPLDLLRRVSMAQSQRAPLWLLRLSMTQLIVLKHLSPT